MKNKTTNKKSPRKKSTGNVSRQIQNHLQKNKEVKKTLDLFEFTKFVYNQATEQKTNITTSSATRFTSFEIKP